MANQQVGHSGVGIERLETRSLMAVTLPAGFVSEPFGGRMDQLSSLAFAPDGRMFAVSQPGTVYITSADGTTTTTALTIPNIASEAEQGLSGIAFDPNFANDPWLYLYYTTPASPTTFVNQLARFRVTGNTIDPASKQVLMDMDPVTDSIHNAGAMRFGPDGKLYLAVGDGAVATNAQSLTNRQGKILRLNPDGTIPADNPTQFTVRQGSQGPQTIATQGVYRSIYAVGLRNPFSLDFNAAGQLIVGDVGQEDWEEIDVITAGANYGWSTSRDGDFNPATYPEFTRPIYVFAHGTTQTTGNAVVGIAAYDGFPAGAPNQFPSSFAGKIFFGEYDGDGWINTIDPAAPPSASNASVFATGFSGMTDMEVGPDGSLYVVQRWTNNPGVLRIKPNTAAAPAIVQQPADKTVAVGEAVTFSVGVAGQAPFTYQWYRGTTAIDGATGPTYTVASPTLADTDSLYYVVVRNGVGTVQSGRARLTVTSDAAPVPVIVAPAVTVLATGGVKIDLVGQATDAEDGVLPGSALEWTVDYYTGSVQRPFVTAFTGSTGSFTPHQVTPYLLTNVFYRISLTATDSNGRKTTVTRDVQPLVTTTTLATNPQGLPLYLNGAQVMSTYSFTGVAGVNREIEAPLTYTQNGVVYNFVSWSNGGPRVQTLATPAENTVLTATYAVAGPPTVTSVSVTGGNTSWGAEVVFSDASVLPSVDRWDFGLSSATQSWIDLTDFTIVFDATKKRATIGFKTAPLAAGTYNLNVYPAGITLPNGTPLASGYTKAFTYTPPLVTPTTVTGRVFNDASNDAVAQSGETGLANVQVWVDANTNGLIDTGEATTTTDANGNYTFALTPGTHAIRAVAPAGAVRTTAATASNVSIASGQVAATAGAIGFYTAPVVTSATLNGRVFVDSNNDGTAQAGEAGLAGVVVWIDANGNGLIDVAESQTTTNASGQYTFANLPAGMYAVRVVAPPNYTLSTPVVASTVTIAAGQTTATAADIGLYTAPTTPPTGGTAKIAGIVFNDLDNDGWRDTGEAGRSAVVMYLDTNNNGVFDTGETSVTTDSGGYYEFRNIATGTYNVRAVRGTLVQTSPAGNAAIVTTVTTAGQSLFLKDIGLASAIAPTLPTPTSLTATAVSAYLVRLNWASEGTNVTAFVIERKTGTGAWTVVSDVVGRTARTYNDYSVGRGVTYVYRVRAKGAVSTGAASNEVTVTSA